MKYTISISLLALLTLPVSSRGQQASQPLPDAPSQIAAEQSGQQSDPPTVPATISPTSNQPAPAFNARFGAAEKFHYYLNETFFNPAALTAPAFRAGLRMANPPGRGATRYPADWRQGAEGFGRNYADAVAERDSFQTARFVTGIITREDPRYMPARSHNVVSRSTHALAFTFVDRSDSGHPMPAISNFVGAAAGGFVGNAYLPEGFNNVTHAGQRATLRFGFFAAGNLFREFAPQMPTPMRTFLTLIAR